MASSRELSVYDNAKHWVAQYASVDDVKDFIDKTAAVQEYARRANDFELEKKAAAARVRAERKCGELLRQMEKAKGTRLNGRGKNGAFRRSTASTTEAHSKTLKELGLSKDQSSKYQRLAEIPEDRFEESLALATTAAGAMGKVTTNGVLSMQESKDPPPRLNTDALWLRGRLKDFEKNLLHQDKAFLLGEMTDAMRRDAERILPKLLQWLA
ncbi:MAG: hypothetical protein DWQ08_00300 [Proteobacteria bacterium]|nr:MAG: hypothetical protein DWQ08_00300 [Pseudomonadota bacterium]